MEKAKILEKLIRQKGFNLKSFSERCKIPYTTLYGIIKNGVGKASVDNIMVICRTLGITIEALDQMAGSETTEEAGGETSPGFEDVELLIARNGRHFTPEQKLELIKLLSELK